MDELSVDVVFLFFARGAGPTDIRPSCSTCCSKASVWGDMWHKIAPTVNLPYVSSRLDVKSVCVSLLVRQLIRGHEDLARVLHNTFFISKEMPAS